MLRKAALLAAGLPQAGFVVYQTNWPPLLISIRAWPSLTGEVWIHVCPSQFRAELCRLPSGPSALIGPTLNTALADVDIGLVGDGSTTIDEAGLFTARQGNGFSVTGFATAMAVSPSGEHIDLAGHLRSSCIGIPRILEPVTLLVDPVLGTQLIGWWFTSDDDEQAAMAGQLALDALLAASVEEILLFVDRP